MFISHLLQLGFTSKIHLLPISLSTTDVKKAIGVRQDYANSRAGFLQTLPYSNADTLKALAGDDDDKDQLNHEQSSRLGTYTNTFAFDNAGNPTTFKGATQTFNTANQNTAQTYDGDGNPKTWQTNTLTFDAGDHLAALGTTLTAGYNAEGLRAWKQSASGTTYFLYEGLTPIVELDGNANVLAINSWGVSGLSTPCLNDIEFNPTLRSCG